MTIGSQRDVSTPFVYRPTSSGSELRFSVRRPNSDEAWTVSFVVADDCGPWKTFVSGGAGNARMGTPIHRPPRDNQAASVAGGGFLFEGRAIPPALIQALAVRDAHLKSEPAHDDAHAGS